MMMLLLDNICLILGARACVCVLGGGAEAITYAQKQQKALTGSIKCIGFRIYDDVLLIN